MLLIGQIIHPWKKIVVLNDNFVQLSIVDTHTNYIYFEQKILEHPMEIYFVKLNPFPTNLLIAHLTHWVLLGHTIRRNGDRLRTWRRSKHKSFSFRGNIWYIIRKHLQKLINNVDQLKEFFDLGFHERGQDIEVPPTRRKGFVVFILNHWYLYLVLWTTRIVRRAFYGPKVNT